MFGEEREGFVVDEGADRVSEEGEEEAAMKRVEPIQATVWEKGLALFVLVLMGSAMAFVAFTVMRYWNRIGV